MRLYSLAKDFIWMHKLKIEKFNYVIRLFNESLYGLNDFFFIYHNYS